MRAKEILKCKCPICNKGSLFMIYENDSEPFLEFIPSYIECDNCNTRFSEIVLDKNDKVETYVIEKCIKYWGNKPILIVLNQKNDKFISDWCPRLGKVQTNDR